MSIYDKSPRAVMTNVLVQTVTIASSSLWFAISVAALCLAAIMPFTKRKLPPIVPRLHLEATVAIRSDPHSTSPGQASMMIPRDGNYRISLDNTTGIMRRTLVRGPITSAITIIPPISGEITITAHPDRPNVAVTATLPPIHDVEEPPIYAEADTSSSTRPHANSSVEDGPSDGQEDVDGQPSALTEPTRRRSLGAAVRLPSVFKRKTRRLSQDNGDHRPRSRSRSLSLTRKLLDDLKPESEEPVIEHSHTPQRLNSDDREMLQTKFVNPFKRKFRQPGSPSPLSTPEKTTCELPSRPTSPAIPSQTPRRSFASYINRAIRPIHDAASRSPSPRRWSLSSTATSSSSDASSSTGSCRSYSMSPCSSRSGTSERPTARTQPYGAPYFAAMPMPSPRRSLSVRVVQTGVAETIQEDDDEVGEFGEVHRERLVKPNLRRANTVARSTALADDRALEAALGQEATRHRRYRSLEVGANIAR